MGMDQIEVLLSRDPNGVEELGKNEKGKLHESQGTSLHVFQYPCAITEPLKSVGVEIRKPKHLYSFTEFMSFAAALMGSEDLQFDSELLQFFAEAENKYPGGISREPREGRCDDQNPQCLPTESKGYLRSLLYSMSNHMPKKRLCSPLTRVNTKAMALIRGMAP